MTKKILRLLGAILVLTLACRMPLEIDPGEGIPPEEPTVQPSPEPPTAPPSEPEPIPTAFTPPTPTPPADEPDQGQEDIPAAPPTPALPPYILQPGSPVAIPNFARPDQGCNWMGVAGQVFDTSGMPQSFVLVEIGGDLVGTPVSQLQLTGSAPSYGPAGFEFTLMSRPIGSTGSLWMRLFDLNGTSLTDQIYFDTYNDCARNLVLINFVELLDVDHRIYLPSTVKDEPLTP